MVGQTTRTVAHHENQLDLNTKLQSFSDYRRGGPLSSDFSVPVGQNSAGKTAFLSPELHSPILRYRSSQRAPMMMPA